MSHRREPPESSTLHPKEPWRICFNTLHFPEFPGRIPRNSNLEETWEQIRPSRRIDSMGVSADRSPVSRRNVQPQLISISEGYDGPGIMTRTIRSLMRKVAGGDCIGNTVARTPSDLFIRKFILGRVGARLSVVRGVHRFSALLSSLHPSIRSRRIPPSTRE